MLQITASHNGIETCIPYVGDKLYFLNDDPHPVLNVMWLRMESWHGASPTLYTRNIGTPKLKKIYFILRNVKFRVSYCERRSKYN